MHTLFNTGLYLSNVKIIPTLATTIYLLVLPNTPHCLRHPNSSDDHTHTVPPMPNDINSPLPSITQCPATCLRSI